jgi:hypothetical protein
MSEHRTVTCWRRSEAHRSDERWREEQEAYS